MATDEQITPTALIEETSKQLAFDGMKRDQAPSNSTENAAENESEDSQPEDDFTPVSEIFRCEGCYKIEIPEAGSTPGCEIPENWPERHFCSKGCQERYAIRRLKKLGIGQRFLHASFENYRVSEQNRRAYEVSKAGAQNLDKGLFLYGAVGAGKTHLMVAMIREMIASKIANPNQILFMPILELLERVKISWETGRRSPIEALKQIPVLFIDDLGMEVVKDWAFQIFLNIVTYRYNEDLPIYISSNLTERELLDRYGSAVFSRLAQMCEIVKLNAPNYRMEHHPDIDIDRDSEGRG